ncbi:hypothetical protein IV203_003303 [Nitzschia inconspicua]|uniref:Uncharacterized protein n=1 Tax=Nitzschia inconspicua TaxID=303405 RepID=A0A9K3L230_9STRA|nr:hypothetical protein IV203_003303 [Nitzschia inconspicua]
MRRNRWWLKLFLYLLNAGTSNDLAVYNKSRTGNSSYSSYMPGQLAFMNSSQTPNQHIKDGQMPVPPGGQEEFGSGQHNLSSRLSGPSNGHPTSSKQYNSHASPSTR